MADPEAHLSPDIEPLTDRRLALVGDWTLVAQRQLEAKAQQISDRGAQARTLGDELILAEADLDLCRQGKEKMFNFAAHRRPEAYGPITARAGIVEPPT